MFSRESVVVVELVARGIKRSFPQDDWIDLTANFLACIYSSQRINLGLAYLGT